MPGTVVKPNPLDSGGGVCSPSLLGEENGRLQAVAPDGKALWHRPFGGASGILRVLSDATGVGILVRVGSDQLMLLDGSSGQVIWRWSVPDGARAIDGWAFSDAPESRRRVVFPTGVANGTLGFCFEFASAIAPPREAWQMDYRGRYDANFGPLCVLADMDNDGVDDVVVAGKPAWIGVLDIQTGAVKFDLRYPITGAPQAGTGRPYGLLHATDLDGDGFRDVVMVSCRVTATESGIAWSWTPGRGSMPD